MNYELVKRILTSLVLLPILIYCSYNSGFYFIIFLSTIYFFSFYEIFKNTKNFLFNFISNIIIIFALFSFYYLRGETSSSLAFGALLEEMYVQYTNKKYYIRDLLKIRRNKAIKQLVS